ncbi:Hypothetical protein Minf_0175 [Methylacidiphilum infernorum V4]|uniref:Uncharacterized protein n=1 Tax=Methylacidiphilum infernorum (isolate V4) TaxID=481448 RepID=B3DXK1_METI4|nr:Hypothetical protein Minf_0175 [Methylacidiphilum infernorum V4]
MFYHEILPVLSNELLDGKRRANPYCPSFPDDIGRKNWTTRPTPSQRGFFRSRTQNSY